jgi:hypothetical protein
MLVVDNALEVIDEYHAKINKFERSVLLRTKMATVRHRVYFFSQILHYTLGLTPIRSAHSFWRPDSSQTDP